MPLRVYASADCRTYPHLQHPCCIRAILNYRAWQADILQSSHRATDNHTPQSLFPECFSLYYLCTEKLRKRSKLLRMNNDLLVEYVLGYELAIYRVFWSSAFCITSNNSFCIAKVLIFSHFTKNSQRKFPFYPHFR